MKKRTKNEETKTTEQMKNEEETKQEAKKENTKENLKAKQQEIAEKELKMVKKEASKFKKFIYRGNVVDMAVGVIVGGAFSTIVTSLVNDIITPLIGIIIGGLDLSNLVLQIGDAKIAYGSFIQSVIDFLIIAICVYTVIRIFERLLHKEEKEKAEEPPKKSDEVVLLEEIRDLLKQQQLKDKPVKKASTKKAEK